MHEILILGIIKSKLHIVLEYLKEFFFQASSIIWVEEPFFYKTNVDCAVGIAVSVKPLANQDDEGMQLYAHIDVVSATQTSFVIDIYLIRSNGAGLEMDEVTIDLKMSKRVKAEILKQIDELFEKYKVEMIRRISEEYRP